VSSAHLDAVKEGAHHLIDDKDGGEGDKPALEGRREELDLPVAVGMVAVGGLRREGDTAEGEHGRNYVDDGLERV
jgi:hypothetical protein